MNRGDAEKANLADLRASGVVLANHPPSMGPDPNDVPPVCTPGQVEWFVDTADPWRVENAERLQALARSKSKRLWQPWKHDEYHITALSTLSLYHAITLFPGPGIWSNTGHMRKDKRGGIHLVRRNIGEAQRLHLRIDYPCRAVDLVIHPASVTYGWDFTEKTFAGAYLAWTVAQAYLHIYAEHERFGVWGHAMSDLVLEGIRLEHWRPGMTDLYAEIMVGS